MRSLASAPYQGDTPEGTPLTHQALNLFYQYCTTYKANRKDKLQALKVARIGDELRLLEIHYL